jgi:hypothetical protein
MHWNYCSNYSLKVTINKSNTGRVIENAICFIKKKRIELITKTTQISTVHKGIRFIICRSATGFPSKSMRQTLIIKKISNFQIISFKDPTLKLNIERRKDLSYIKNLKHIKRSI